MDLSQTSNPDPHGVQRLLSLLRTQQDNAANKPAGVQSPSASHRFFPPAQPDTSIAKTRDGSQDQAAHTSRRSYNSEPRFGTGQLVQNDVYDPYSFNPFAASTESSGPVTSRSTPTKPTTPPLDRTTMTFAQSLPLLSSLAADPLFITELRSMRNEQYALERKLASQYQSHATLARATPQHQQQQSQADRDRTFRESVLQQWDDLRAKQSSRLAELNVPTFGNTSPIAAKQQAKVFAVLVSMLDDEADS